MEGADVAVVVSDQSSLPGGGWEEGLVQPRPYNRRWPNPPVGFPVIAD